MFILRLGGRIIYVFFFFVVAFSCLYFFVGFYSSVGSLVFLFGSRTLFIFFVFVFVYTASFFSRSFFGFRVFFIFRGRVAFIYLFLDD